MHVVACAFEEARIAARLVRNVELGLPLVAWLRVCCSVLLRVGPDEVAVGCAGDVAHATAEAHGIGGHHAVLVLGEVRQHHLALCAFVEGEGAEVDPCAATHLLVHGKLGLAVLMVDGITCVGRAVGQCLVRHIHGILAVHGHVGCPAYCALLTLLRHGIGHTERAFGEGVLKVLIFGSEVSEALSLALCPRLGAVGLGIDRVVLGHGAVGLLHGHVGIVVYHHLIGVGVALTRCHDNGTGVLQHRYDVRQDVALRIFVLHALEHASALPLPSCQALLIVETVALPHGNVLAVESVSRVVGSAEVAHQRCAFRLCERLSLVLAFEVGAQDEVFEVFAVGNDGDLLVGQLLWQHASHLLHYRHVAVLAYGQIR